MWLWFVFGAYVCISATGLLFIKIGASASYFSLHNYMADIRLSAWFLFGFTLYICSFLLSLYVMSHMKLSVFYPIGTGVVLMLSCFFGYFFLKESVTLPQIIGIVLILCGIAVMNIG